GSNRKSLPELRSYDFLARLYHLVSQKDRDMVRRRRLYCAYPLCTGAVHCSAASIETGPAVCKTELRYGNPGQAGSAKSRLSLCRQAVRGKGPESVAGSHGL